MENNNKKNKKSIGIVIFIIMVAVISGIIGAFISAQYLDNSETSEKRSSKIIKDEETEDDEENEKSDTKENKKDNTKNEKNVQKGTKTLMIYMCGSNLESKSAVATCNLDDLISSEADFDNINIILCAGGSKEWHNNVISETETSYFKVSKDNLENIKKQTVRDMASYTTLTNFIDYAYDNYKADEYYLMLWDHGGALAGLEQDELSNNNMLSLKDLNTALKNTKLNKSNKKFDLTIFNNCLMGCLEVANIMSNYSNYMVASEDSMLGGYGITTFDFLSGIKPSDDEVKIGKSYIDAYTKAIKKTYSGTYITLSLLDLSKIKNVVSELDTYFKAIKLDETNFRKIAQIRADLYEYDRSNDCWDMVDLHQLITKLQPVNSNNKNLLKAIENAVVYKSVTDPYSKGISTYFPESNDWSGIYDTIDYSDVYKKFTKDYIAIFTGKKKASMSMVPKDITKIDNGFSMQLTDEEKQDYKSSQFVIFEDNGDGTYNTVLTSNDTKMDESGNVTANIDNKLLSVVDKSDGTVFPLGYIIDVDRTDDYIMYDVPIILVEPYGEDYITPMTPALMNIKVYKDGRIEKLATRDFSSPSGIEGKKSSNGAIFDITDSEKYKSIYFIKSARKIDVDENGNYEKLGDLSTTQGISVNINSEFTFEKTDLDSNKKYVGVFVVTDVYGNKYSSKLIEIK